MRRPFSFVLVIVHIAMSIVLAGAFCKIAPFINTQREEVQAL